MGQGEPRDSEQRLLPLWPPPLTLVSARVRRATVQALRRDARPCDAAPAEVTGYRGSGGPNGDRVWWPAGLCEMTPSERVHALAHGWWYDGADIVTRDGRRLSPVSTALSTDRRAEPELNA